MVEFLFFRHGETDWNKAQFFQGHTDIPLNLTGQNQARLMGEKIQHWKPDIVLSSDLTRACQTAEGAQAYWQAPIIFSDKLREMNLGKAEGLHRDEVMKLIGSDWTRWVSPSEDDEHFGFPGGETKGETRQRVLKYIEDFVKKNPHYKRIAVSTHGGVLKRVTHGLQGVPQGGVAIPNCVTYRLNYKSEGWEFIPDRHRASTVVTFDQKILTYQAVDPHDQTQYHFVPGGVLEENESHVDCARRETFEETGYSVEVNPQKQISVEYDFTWNGQKRWCRTEFFRAQLQGEYYEPRPIKDASYHRGVVWRSQQDVHSLFEYSQPIQHSIKKLVPL